MQIKSCFGGLKKTWPVEEKARLLSTGAVGLLEDTKIVRTTVEETVFLLCEAYRH